MARKKTTKTAADDLPAGGAVLYMACTYRDDAPTDEMIESVLGVFELQSVALRVLGDRPNGLVQRIYVNHAYPDGLALTDHG